MNHNLVLDNNAIFPDVYDKDKLVEPSLLDDVALLKDF